MMFCRKWVIGFVVVLTAFSVSVVAQTPKELATYTGPNLPAIETVSRALVLRTKGGQGFVIHQSDGVRAQATQLGAIHQTRLTVPVPAGRPSISPPETWVMTFKPDVDLDRVIAALYRDPSVDYVEPIYPIQLFSLPNDPEFKKQPYFNTHGLTVLGIPANHDVKIAILDTGIDSDNTELAGRVINNHPETFDDHGHGTHLAGIIAARINNKIGIAGLNHRAKLMPYKLIDRNGVGNQLDAAIAIQAATDNGARIILCSWGYFVYNQVLKDAVQYALSNGVVVIAAMGNDGVALKYYPAGFPNVIAVGAMTSDEERAPFSNTGTHLSFMAPGIDVVSIAPYNKQSIRSGTSQSAAIVAGVVSRILSFKPQLTGSELTTLLLFAAEPIGIGQRNPDTGYGYIDGEKLIKALNIPSPNTIIVENGIEIGTSDTDTQEPESIFTTVLMAPLRGIGWLFSILI